MQESVDLATIAQAGAIGNQGGSRNLKRFKAHDPPALKGRGDLMMACNYFRLLGKVTGAEAAIITQASIVAATIVWTNAIMGQGGTSNLQEFQAHHPPTYMGRGDSMVSTALAIGREVDETQSIWHMGASTKRKKNQSSSNSGTKR